MNKSKRDELLSSDLCFLSHFFLKLLHSFNTKTIDEPKMRIIIDQKYSKWITHDAVYSIWVSFPSYILWKIIEHDWRWLHAPKPTKNVIEFNGWMDFFFVFRASVHLYRRVDWNEKNWNFVTKALQSEFLSFSKIPKHLTLNNNNDSLSYFLIELCRCLDALQRKWSQNIFILYILSILRENQQETISNQFL